MKRKWWYAICVCAIAAALYVPHGELYRENVYSYRHPGGKHMSCGEAERLLKSIGNKISRAETAGQYSPEQRYPLEEALRRIRFSVDVPDKYLVNGRVVAYQDESDSGHALYWQAWNLEFRSEMLTQKSGWSDADRAEWTRLTSRPEVQWIWKPELKQYPKSRHAEQLANKRLTYGLPFMLAVLLLRLADARWNLRRMFNRNGLQLFGYVLTLGLSISCAPALGQQLLAKLKKDERRSEETLDPDASRKGNVPPEAPKPWLQLTVEAFGDTRSTHDQQQIVVGTTPLNNRFSLAAMIQNRQATSGKSWLSFGGLGVRTAVTDWLSLTVITGPQYEWKKHEVDQHTTFVNGLIKRPNLTLLSINRFSRGLSEDVAPAHRHIIAARAGPMPEWLTVQTEIRRYKRAWDESFWGLSLGIGKALPKPLKRWIGGLYAYPYYDFISNSWDIRLGLTRSFAFR